jgi:LysR family glycine cleavage system transcriptional activator
LKRGEIPSIGGLTSFVAAAQHGSFTRAADELHLTQGAISRQIREVESHLGIRLFERIRQRVVLTDVGRIYLAEVKKALDELAGASQRVASLSNASRLNLVVLPTFAARWLVHRLPTFLKTNPTIMIHVTTRQSPIDFATEPFDAAVFHSASHWPGTISHYLMDADMIAVCSPKLNARHAIKTPADVAKFPLLHMLGEPSRWPEWMAQGGVTLSRPLHGHSYQNFAMIAQAAVAGLGIALLPRYLVEDEVAAKQLEIVANEFVDLKTLYYLILPETRASSNAVQSFAKWLIAEAQAFKSAKPANRQFPHKRQTARRANGKRKTPLGDRTGTRLRVVG